MLKLKLQYFGHLMGRTNSLEKTLMLGKTEAGEGDNGGWGGWMSSPTWWRWVWASSGSWWWHPKQGGLACCSPMGSGRVGPDWVTELILNHEGNVYLWIKTTSKKTGHRKTETSLDNIIQGPRCSHSWSRNASGTFHLCESIHFLLCLSLLQAPGVGDGQGSLACCSPSGCKELDTTEWTEVC